MNISETSWPIAIKFYLKHYWGWEKAALGFGPDQIRTLATMATDSSHKVIMGKTALQLFLSCFDLILFILAGNKDMHKILKKFEIRPDPITDCRLSCPGVFETRGPISTHLIYGPRLPSSTQGHHLYKLRRA